MAQGTEVTYKTTGDCSLEIGTPKDGRVKLFFTEEEIDDIEKGEAKINKMDALLSKARSKFNVRRTRS